jgi:hypothetical protein
MAAFLWGRIEARIEGLLRDNSKADSRLPPHHACRLLLRQKSRNFFRRTGAKGAFGRLLQMNSSVIKISVRDDSRLGSGGWFAIVVLVGFLIAALAYTVRAWTALDGVQISVAGWIFMGLGAVFTVLVGGGLMALVFYSSRHDYDR